MEGIRRGIIDPRAPDLGLGQEIDQNMVTSHSLRAADDRIHQKTLVPRELNTSNIITIIITTIIIIMSPNKWIIRKKVETQVM